MCATCCNARQETDVPDLIPARMLNEFCHCSRLAYLEWMQGGRKGKEEGKGQAVSCIPTGTPQYRMPVLFSKSARQPVLEEPRSPATIWAQ